MSPHLRRAVPLMAAASLCLPALVAARPAADLPRPAAAATPPQATRADPLDPAAPVPPLHYRSAFDGYRPHAEQPVGAWDDVNRTVGQIGGWRAYAKETSEPDAARPPAPAASPAATGTATPRAPAAGVRP